METDILNQLKIGMKDQNREMIAARQERLIYSRMINPELDLRALESTRNMYDSKDSVSQYYNIRDKTSFFENIIIDHPPILDSDNLILHEQIEERSLDADYCQLFLHRSYSRLKKPCRLNVIDFGGNAGTHFYQCIKACDRIINSWTVVELPQIISQATQIQSELVAKIDLSFALDKLHFAEKIEAVKTLPGPTVIICNGVLMHLQDPCGILAALIQMRPSSILLGNNFEIDENFFVLSNKLFGKSRSNDYIIVKSGPRDGIAVEHYFAMHREERLLKHVFNVSESLGMQSVDCIRSERRNNALRINYGIGSAGDAGEIRAFPSFDKSYNVSIFFE